MTWESDSDRVWELHKSVKILEAGNKRLRRRLDELKADLSKTNEALHDAVTRISVLQAQFEDLKKPKQESAGLPFWVYVVMVWLALIANVVVVFLGR